jgi:hypothetical protein
MTTHNMIPTAVALAFVATAMTASLAVASPKKNAPGAKSPTAGEIAPPDASGFAAVLVTSTTDYVKASGASLRMQRTDCVEPRPGRYMCSYSLRAPGGTDNCHLVQARWTPAGTSLFTVTLAGRTRSCADLSDALGSLDPPRLAPA